jgi:hypothetical protein
MFFTRLGLVFLSASLVASQPLIIGAKKLVTEVRATKDVLLDICFWAGLNLNTENFLLSSLLATGDL